MLIVSPATVAVSPDAEVFYIRSLELLGEAGLPFLLGGTYAVCAYTGICRSTKDLDVFCKAGDYPRILEHFCAREFVAEIEDERWIAKVRHDAHFFDVIFNSTVAVVPVTDSWFAEAPAIHVHGVEARLVPPTELLWSKVFIQDRCRYDGADVAHVILKQHASIDWHRLLAYMDPYWEVLLIHLLNFRFIYPGERELVPRWLFGELVARLETRAGLPAPRTKVCRGRLFSRREYLADITEWGFADVVGEGEVKPA